MNVTIDESVIPDIDKVETVRVAVATNLKTGKQGVVSFSTGAGTFPLIWADDERTEKFMGCVKQIRRDMKEMRIDIVEFVRKKAVILSVAREN